MRHLAALALLLTLGLLGCAPSPGAGAQENAAATPATTAEAPPSTTAEAVPSTTAEDGELARFRAALEGQSPLDPDALVDAVEAAGFARSSIERTRELDSLGAPVTFLEIATRVDDGCLIGQVGDGPPVAIRAAALGGGRCLVGDVIGLD